MLPSILVGTKHGLHVLGKQDQLLFQGDEVGYLTTQNDDWWIVVNKGQIWRHVEDKWEHIQTLEGLRINCLLPYDGNLLIGTSQAHLYELKAKATHRISSFELVSNRDEWFTPWGGPPDVRSISADSMGNLFVNVHVGGILRSRDGGCSWEPTIDLTADVHQVLVHQESDRILAPSGRGLAVSLDQGQSWNFYKDGLHGSYQRAVTIADDFALVSSSTGPHTHHAAIYRRPLGDTGPFEQCGMGLPEWFSDNIDTFCLDASGSSVALGTKKGEIFLSTDKGATWSRIAEGFPPVLCLAFI